MQIIKNILHNLIQKFRKYYLIFFILFCFLILLFSVRGIKGNPSETDLLQKKWTDYGPFELSPERGRFALLYSMMENKSFFFSTNIAKFATPDVAFYNNKYVSLFAPGISVAIIPGYLIGKALGIAQVGTFLFISFFAVLNTLLIVKISQKLGASITASLLGALIFLFATPAFSYAVSLYQHHISTFLILLGIYIVMTWKNFWGSFIIFFLSSLSIVIDNPNFFFMFPIALLAFINFFSINKSEGKFKIKINILHLFSIFSVAIPLVFFLIYNQQANGSLFKLSGAIHRAQAIDDKGNPYDPAKINKENASNLLPVTASKKDPIKFFQTRNLLNGFYIHFVSPDRGILYFSPIILFGILGFYFIKKPKHHEIHALLWSIIGTNVLLYSMWGDPWGGWAFGSRYLIPAYALLAIFLSIGLTKWENIKWYLKILIFIPFIIALFYSIRVNTMGALTTSSMPPKVQVLYLESLTGKEEKYTYKRNEAILLQNESKAFLFVSYFSKYINAWSYFSVIYTLLIIISVVLTLDIFLMKGNTLEITKIKFNIKRNSKLNKNN